MLSFFHNFLFPKGHTDIQEQPTQNSETNPSHEPRHHTLQNPKSLRKKDMSCTVILSKSKHWPVPYNPYLNKYQIFLFQDIVSALRGGTKFSLLTDHPPHVLKATLSPSYPITISREIPFNNGGKAHFLINKENLNNRSIIVIGKLDPIRKIRSLSIAYNPVYQPDRYGHPHVNTHLSATEPLKLEGVGAVHVQSNQDLYDAQGHPICFENGKRLKIDIDDENKFINISYLFKKILEEDSIDCKITLNDQFVATYIEKKRLELDLAISIPYKPILEACTRHWDQANHRRAATWSSKEQNSQGSRNNIEAKKTTKNTKNFFEIETLPDLLTTEEADASSSLLAHCLIERELTPFGNVAIAADIARIQQLSLACNRKESANYKDPDTTKSIQEIFRDARLLEKGYRLMFLEPTKQFPPQENCIYITKQKSYFNPFNKLALFITSVSQIINKLVASYASQNLQHNTWNYIGRYAYNIANAINRTSNSLIKIMVVGPDKEMHTCTSKNLTSKLSEKLNQAYDNYYKLPSSERKTLTQKILQEMGLLTHNKAFLREIKTIGSPDLDIHIYHCTSDPAICNDILVQNSHSKKTKNNQNQGDNNIWRQMLYYIFARLKQLYNSSSSSATHPTKRTIDQLSQLTWLNDSNTSLQFTGTTRDLDYIFLPLLTSNTKTASLGDYLRVTDNLNLLYTRVLWIAGPTMLSYFEKKYGSLMKDQSEIEEKLKIAHQSLLKFLSESLSLDPYLWEPTSERSWLNNNENNPTKQFSVDSLALRHSPL